MKISLEMSISREDFLRLLPSAVGQVVVAAQDGVFGGGDDHYRWEIRLQKLEDRRLGSVVLPFHRVDIRLEGHSEDEAAAFMTRFQRGFQRGGG